MLADRLANRMRHLAKWGRRQDIGCFRLYERDIPDFPLVVDWFADEDAAGPEIARAGDAVAWFHDRTKDETPEQAAAYRAGAVGQILDGLGIPPDRLWVKERGRQRAEEGGRRQYERVDERGVSKVVREHGSRFEINLSDYLDVGLFLDHRPTRGQVRERAEGKRVLNLFAYTGAFTVHARAGGAAATTTVDMSRTYLDWFERNLALNGMAPDADHRTVHADCLQWLEAGPAAGEAYDIVICDPPTFSNSKRMAADSFAIERDHPQLLRQLCRFVAPGGEVFFSTNARRFHFDEAAVPEGFGVHEISRRSVPEDFRNRKIHRCWRLAEGWTPRGR
jgi:23S rRNA (cytosine1962-C5)-methyltransferase